MQKQPKAAVCFGRLRSNQERSRFIFCLPRSLFCLPIKIFIWIHIWQLEKHLLEAWYRSPSQKSNQNWTPEIMGCYNDRFKNVNEAQNGLKQWMPQRMCDPFKVLNVLEIFLGIFKLQKSSRWLLRNIPALLRQILLQAQLFLEEIPKKSWRNPKYIQEKEEEKNLEEIQI